jgi:hypothetical protein
MGKLTEKLSQDHRDRGPGDDRRTARAQPACHNPSWRGPAHVYAKSVGSFLPKLTRKAFEKYGFSAATLVTDWALIAGAEVAAATAPERLKWPRGAGAGEDAADGGGSGSGATLLLRVDPARALDVEYRRRQIVERINAYFGYRAVAEIRLVQAPLAPRKAPEPVRPHRPLPQVASGGADPLTDALLRLETGVRNAARTA